MKLGFADDSQFHNNGQARIIVFGVGGGGGNAVENMVNQNVKGITFVCANTDLQVLNKMSAPNKIQLGVHETEGLGAGGNPEVGRSSAESSEEEIRAILQGYNMAFITAGMGGGTGTGAAPVVARIAKELGILTVAVVTTPFTFEGKRRVEAAKAGIDALTQYVDSIIVIPNDKLRQIYRNMTMMDAFRKADEVLLNAVTGLTETIEYDGYMNIDFRDVTTAMAAKGYAMMGIGRASGQDRAIEAMDKAVRSPLLDDLNLRNAKGLIVNCIGMNISMEEIEQIQVRVHEIADENAEIFFGFVNTDDLGDELKITVVATGLTVNTPSARPMMASNPSQNLASHTSALSQQQVQQTVAPTAPQPLSIGSYLQQQQLKNN